MAAKNVGIRLEEATIARLDALAKALSRPGLEITRTDAARLCIESGLVTEEEKIKGAAAPPKP